MRGLIGPDIIHGTFFLEASCMDVGLRAFAIGSILDFMNWVMRMSLAFQLNVIRIKGRPCRSL